MDYKKLKLDWAKIPGLIKEYFGLEQDCLREKGNGKYEFRQNINGKEILLNIWRTNKGLTTILHDQGVHKDEQKAAAEFIIKGSKMDDRDNLCIAFRDFEEENLDLLEQYLAESEYGRKTEERQGPNGLKIVRYVGCFDDEVTINYFPTTKTMMLQGRPISLWAQITAFLSDYLSLEEIIEAQSKFVEVPLVQSELEYEVTARMPYAMSALDGTTRKMLSTAAGFMKLDVEFQDYSSFAFPALRGLEAHLKAVFVSKGRTISDAEGFGCFFANSNGRHTLNSIGRSLMACSTTCTLVENAYNYYKKHRHSLFHAAGVPVASRIIEKREDAIAIIDAVFYTIENHYRTLAS